jgi:D-sedoheptulose 7-phosphate isomerase
MRRTKSPSKPSSLAGPIAARLRESSKVLAGTARLAPLLARAAAILIEAYRSGGKVIAFGNGGSALDALNFADELVGRYERNRRPLPALALTANPADLTSISNDFGFEEVFARQLEAHARPGDVAVAISTSGNSPNVLKAAERAAALGLKTIGLTGQTGGRLKGLVGLCVCVPSTTVARIQEAHIAVIQTWCGLIEDALFPDAPKAH